MTDAPPRESEPGQPFEILTSNGVIADCGPVLHVLLGDSSGDPEALFSGVDRNGTVAWMVPKSSSEGDEVIFHLGGQGFVAFGAIASAPQKTDQIGWYSAQVGNLRKLRHPVKLEMLYERLPDWKWLRYPRSYTPLHDSIEAGVREAVETHQRNA